jgi:hypothetical protein
MMKAMDAFQYEVLPWLILSGVIAVLVVIYWGNSNTAPARIQRTAFRIRLLSKWVLYLFGLVLFFAVILPLVIEEGLMWLAPESRYGYAEKYHVNLTKVSVDPKPHDCEWGKAPIGSKYCHFEKIVLTDKNEHSEVTAVYVKWEKVQD